MRRRRHPSIGNIRCPGEDSGECVDTLHEPLGQTGLP